MKTTLSLIVGMIIGAATMTFSAPLRLATGIISATPSESQDCYFVIGDATVIKFVNGSVPCLHARQLVGTKVDMWFEEIK